MYGLVGLLVFAAAGTAAAVKLGYISFEQERPRLGPSPDDPPQIVEAYQQGKVAFEEERWEEALMLFQNVQEMPNTYSARDLMAKDYIGRIIADVLEDAVDARERAKTDKDLELAASGPLALLEFYPEHEATQQVLRSIEAAGKEMGAAPKLKSKPSEQRKPKRKKPPIRIEGIN